MNKKILTIHSEDRDINKWPDPNEFELLLPDSYTNIEEMNLLNITLTNNFYNISEKLMNNYINTNELFSSEYIIRIPDGFYTPDTLALTLTKLLQKIYPNKIYVLYDRIKIKFLFIVSSDNVELSLNFKELVSTDELCINKKFLANPEKIANQYDHWGIGYNLGFKKKLYKYDEEFKFSTSPLDKDVSYSTYINNFDLCLNDVNKILPQNIDFFTDSYSYKFLYSETTIDLNPFNTIYMEIDRYNYADEIMPYQYRSNYLYCNDYNASVNSYFAKILLHDLTNNQNKILTFTSSNGEIYNGNILYKNKIDRLIKLKFKFRYHNGILVDFNDKNFNFTLQFSQGDNVKNY